MYWRQRKKSRREREGTGKARATWVIVRIDGDEPRYWYEMGGGTWSHNRYAASGYSSKREAESVAVRLCAENPDLISKVRVENLYGEEQEYEQGTLF